MLYAEKGNRVCNIEERDIERYLSQGYNITDGNGHIISESIPTDMQTLKNAYVDSKAKIEALNKTIDELKAEIEALKKPSVQTTRKSTSKKSTKSEETIEE